MKDTGWAVLGAPAFAPEVLAGFLSGFVTGTAMNLPQREALTDIAEG